MVIGVDFDNTIVCYDSVFHTAAAARELMPASGSFSKRDVRSYLRDRGQENAWIELQGDVYGARMIEATPFEGALVFFKWCIDNQVRTYVISHRTRYPFLGKKHDLHEAARGWLQHYGFFEQTGLTTEELFFEVTKEQKLQRIEQMRCDVFIDDLPEFLGEAGFPVGVTRLLFDPRLRHVRETQFELRHSWQEIQTRLMREVVVS